MGRISTSDRADGQHQRLPTHTAQHCHRGPAHSSCNFATLLSFNRAFVISDWLLSAKSVSEGLLYQISARKIEENLTSASIWLKTCFREFLCKFNPFSSGEQVLFLPETFNKETKISIFFKEDSRLSLYSANLEVFNAYSVLDELEIKLRVRLQDCKSVSLVFENYHNNFRN